jgi:hypothetical protein
MVTFDCPWCTEPVELDTPALDELTCDACSITVEIAPEPAARRIDRAA